MRCRLKMPALAAALLTLPSPLPAAPPEADCSCSRPTGYVVAVERRHVIRIVALARPVRARASATRWSTQRMFSVAVEPTAANAS